MIIHSNIFSTLFSSLSSEFSPCLQGFERKTVQVSV
jgi:hypothetical protein